MSNKKIRKANKKRRKEKQKLRKKNNILRTKFGIEVFDCRHSEFKNIVVSNLEKILGNLDKYFNSAQVRVLRCFYLLNILHKHSNYSKNTIRRTEYTDRIHALFENAFNAFWDGKKAKSESEYNHRVSILCDVMIDGVIKRLGEVVFEMIPKDKLKEYCPENMFQLGLGGNNKIRVSFTEILTKSTDLGRLFFPDSDNKIIVNRLPANLAFASHAYDRIIQRCLLGDKPKSHYDLSLLHGVVSGKMHYEVKGETLELYFMCSSTEIASACGRGLTRNLMWDNTSNSTNLKYVVRTGYCPLSFYRDKVASNNWVAKTFLVTGMRNTPESLAYRGLDSDKEKRIYQGLDHAINDHIPFLVWLHCKGYPCFYEFTDNPENPIGKPVNFDWLDEMKGIEDPTILLECC